MARKKLPARRGHITQRVKIGSVRTLYLSVDKDDKPSEVFLRIRGKTDDEKTACYDVIARLISLAIQEDISIEAIAKRLHGTRTQPAGPVEGDEHVKFCDGTLDFVGRHLLVRYCGRSDLAHVRKGKPLPYSIEEGST